MLRPLEDRFTRPDPMPTHVTGIVLLGGAIDLPVSTTRHVTALNIRAERMLGFLQLAHRYPKARLVFTGGNASPFGGRATEAAVARRLFVSLGINPRRMLFENRSRNTRENALYTYRLVKPKPGQIWLLVTSAADMPRAVGCFRQVGWMIVPYPVDYHTRAHGAAWLTGLARSLTLGDWAAHEWLGLVYYRIRGWIPVLFPAPIRKNG
ncbi:YdcF family protein [Acidihalobacter ferrooxydans]|uniref:YdcF family protein n=1 Tax=Acidihalobacter ferrooxydans TaxID=1765967 RepID=UPI001E3CA628|nr:YdcF family protein [Acidihalobacter ferrooxydans]